MRGAKNFDVCSQETIGHGIIGVILSFVAVAVLDGGWNTGILLLDHITSVAFYISLCMAVLFPFPFCISWMIATLICWLRGNLSSS